MEERIKSNKDNTLIIMAGSGGFPFDGYVAEGYKTASAYKPTNVPKRLLREICFRLPLLPKRIWYNQSLIQYDPAYVYVRDAIISRSFLLWILKLYPHALIVFSYENLVGHARHLMPNQIPEGIRVWTFDSADSKKYNLKLRKVVAYFQSYLKPRKEKKYDLLFVGRDKGRGDQLKELEKFLNERGIRTKFLITADTKFSKKKQYYEEPVSYDQVTEWVSESRALLNVSLDGQDSVTMRDIESHFNQIKLVTTNQKIKNTEIYEKENTFFLTDDNWESLAAFLKTEYVDEGPIIWDGHRIEDAIAEVMDSI